MSNFRVIDPDSVERARRLAGYCPISKARVICLHASPDVVDFAREGEVMLIASYNDALPLLMDWRTVRDLATWLAGQASIMEITQMNWDVASHCQEAE